MHNLPQSSTLSANSITEKIWFIEIDGQHEGPFSLLDLKRDLRLTPDTLVWKVGFPQWIAIRDVPELKEVFADEVQKDDSTETEESEEENAKKDSLSKNYAKGEIVLTVHQDFPPFLIWLLIVLIIFLYVYYNMFLFHTNTPGQ